ncbi:MAG: cysteine desulfurase [Clostridia bacterium]|nr:cysteine desulfurase [Clostridia bacterium]
MTKIYLDNAATTRPDAGCLEKAKIYLGDKFYNPSSMYGEGYDIRREIDKSRENILSCVARAEEFELIFTSCGTEADNQALFCGAKRGNVVTTIGEHPAVYNAALELKQRGVDVRIAPLLKDGTVNVDNLLSLVDEKTSIVSCMHVNNETGALNDIDGISALVKDKNPAALFHSDGVQAFGKIPYRLGKCVDMYTISAHKIGALKGTGALIKRKKISIKPYIYGGGQEKGMRSGTENVFGIKMFEFAALKRYSEISENYKRATDMFELLCSLLDPSFFKIIGERDMERRSPYVLCVSAPGVRGETILHEVSDKGLLIGSGSACSSNEKKRYSRVILAQGVSEAEADGILRISLSPETTSEEIEKCAKILNETVKFRLEMMK